ncbi:glycosyltransferase family 2 protein [uncultured Pseudacidovorax sp.]|uniref:glycosyltransferase family 2 protein n=1 Tax=uncultured Pseudacidovorax sp. TaxID=679313 RepID=UPI0025DECA80|nr:glycosyltransferase family 2 protein [uncultured Pseudacidovorax sp.]
MSVVSSLDPARCAHWSAACAFSPFANTEYRAWIARESSSADAEREALRTALTALPHPSGITFVVADDTNERAVRATLSSLAAQVCLQFDVLLSCSPARRAAMSGVLALVPQSLKVRVIVASEGDVTVPALQQLALTHAGGEHVGLLSAGDQLAPTAVAALRMTLARWPETDIVYADEDWIAADGTRCRPRFKPGWDPEAQLGFDLLEGLCLFRRAEVLRSGGLRPEFGPAARYELGCRIGLPLPAWRVRHIPAVLCHRRIPLAPDSAATARAIEAYAAAARRAAQQVASMQSGTPVEVAPSILAPVVNWVRRPLPQPAPRVSILVPTRDRADLLANCLNSLLRHTDYPDLEVVVLDNDSTEPQTHALFAQLRQDPRVRILKTPGAFNFSRINNLGARAATGEVLLFLNNDTEILDADWLKEMVAQAMRPDIGCVGAKLLYADGTVQHAGVILQPDRLAMHVSRTDDAMAPGADGRLAGARGYLAVTGACLAIRREVFQLLGGFDEKHLAIAFNDVDLCLKATDAGYRNVCTPFATLLHLESVSRGHDHANEEKQQRAARELGHITAKWPDRFAEDRFHNPNVRLDWYTGTQLAAYEARWQLAR